MFTQFNVSKKVMISQKLLQKQTKKTRPKKNQTKLITREFLFYSPYKYPRSLLFLASCKYYLPPTSYKNYQ